MVAFALLAALALASPTAAQAAPEWLEPQDLSGPGDLGDSNAGEEVQVALDPHGNAVAIWRRYSGSIRILQAATRRAGGAWSAPQGLSPATQDAFSARLALDSQGNAVVVWAASTGGKVIAMAATRPAAGGSERDGWSPSHTLSAPGQDAYAAPRVAVDAQGDAVAIWTRSPGTDAVVQAATRPAGGAWSEPQDLSASGADLFDTPQVALDALGNAVAIWTRSDGGHVIAEAATRAAGGSWDRTVLSAPGHGTASPGLALDGEGNAVAIWRNYDGVSLTLQVADRRAGGGWSAPQKISGSEDANYVELAVDPEGNAVSTWRGPAGVYAATRPAGHGWSAAAQIGPVPDNGPHVVVDRQGNAVAFWRRYLVDDLQVIQAAGHRFGGSWGTPEDLSNPVGNADGPQMAFDAGGNGVAVWRRYDGTNRTIEAATRSPGGAWSDPRTISRTPSGALFDVVQPPRLAVDPQGNAVATWRRYDGLSGTGSAVPKAVGFDAAGPQLHDLRVPATGRVGASLEFSVAPLDAWSQVSETTWSFGDNTSAGGQRVVHAYAAPGSYDVTVSSTDSLGNASSEKRTVVVSSAGGGSGGGGTGGGIVGGGPVRGTGAKQPGTGGFTGGPSAGERSRAAALRRCLRRATTVRRTRRRCLARYGRRPGPIRRLRARALSPTTVALSFRAPGSDGRRGPVARTYVIKQSLRPFRGSRGFRRARSLCRGSCRLSVKRVGERVRVVIKDLRPGTTYYYAIAARDDVSRRLGPRSRMVRARTR